MNLLFYGIKGGRGRINGENYKEFHPLLHWRARLRYDRAHVAGRNAYFHVLRGRALLFHNRLAGRIRVQTESLDSGSALGSVDNRRGVFVRAFSKPFARTGRLGLLRTAYECYGADMPAFFGSAGAALGARDIS